MCGLGTVAQGVLNVLRDNGDAITQRAGREIQLTQVASRNPKPDVDLGHLLLKLLCLGLGR